LEYEYYVWGNNYFFTNKLAENQKNLAGQHIIQLIFVFPENCQFKGYLYYYCFDIK